MSSRNGRAAAMPLARTLPLDDAFALCACVIPRLDMGEALHVDSTAAVRNGACSVTQLVSGLDVEDCRVGESGQSVGSALNVIEDVLTDIEQNSPIREVTVSVFRDGDVDEATGEWREAA